MDFRPLTLEEQFFQKPIFVTPIDLTKGGVVPLTVDDTIKQIQLDKPQLFKNDSPSKFMKHFSNNWGWYVGFFIAGMIAANYIINKQQEPKQKNNSNILN